MTEFFKHNLEIYFIENKAEADRIAVLVQQAAASRRKGARSIKKTSEESRQPRAEVWDCRSRLADMRYIYVEGDSAWAASKPPDAEYQGIMPCAARSLNCLKATMTAFSKAISSRISSRCWAAVDGRKQGVTNTLANLRWSKVIICTDADVDGYQIRTLILTMIYRLVPSLIEEGYVYIAESPCMRSRQGQDVVAYTEPEKAEF